MNPSSNVTFQEFTFEFCIYICLIHPKIEKNSQFKHNDIIKSDFIELSQVTQNACLANVMQQLLKMQICTYIGIAFSTFLSELNFCFKKPESNLAWYLLFMFLVDCLDVLYLQSLYLIVWHKFEILNYFAYIFIS